MSQSLTDIFSQFEPVSLSEMEAVKLMDRTDTKFSFHANRLPELLNQLKGDYKLLHIEQTCLASYCTLYFDSADYKLYLKHHSGALNRYKVRHRSYTDSHLAFLEVKFKNNKGRTLKKRINMPEVPNTWDQRSAKFISANTPYVPDMLKPVIWINYRRLTLVGKHSAERVTIDLDLHFEFNERHQSLPNLVIAEVKQAGKTRTPVLNTLRNMRIKPESLSKYCLGMASLYPELKHNNFKEKIIYLNKINHDNSFKFASGF